GGTAAAAVGVWGAWLLLKESGAYQLIVRLSTDDAFLKQTREDLGILAPLIFIGFQALQVIISPIPGEPVGLLGGYLFGVWGGFVYSMIGSPSDRSRASPLAAGSVSTSCESS